MLLVISKDVIAEWYTVSYTLPTPLCRVSQFFTINECEDLDLLTYQVCYRTPNLTTFWDLSIPQNCSTTTFVYIPLQNRQILLLFSLGE